MRPTPEGQKQKDQMFSSQRRNNQNPFRFISDLDSGVSSNASSSLTINTCVPITLKDKQNIKDIKATSPREMAPYYRARGQTISSRMPAEPIPEHALEATEGILDSKNRKESGDSCLGESFDESDDMFSFTRTTYQRRMSVPASVFNQANYAILRQNDRQYDIVAAFCRDTLPFECFLKSLTSYDLVSKNSIVPYFHEELSLHKAIKAFIENDHQAGLICDDVSKCISIFTDSDCMEAIWLYNEGKVDLNLIKLKEYLMLNDIKRDMISASTTITAWDLGKLMVRNKVKRIPIYEEDRLSQDCMAFVTLKHLFTLTIAKIMENKNFALTDLTKWTLGERNLESFDPIEVINKNSPLKEAVGRLLKNSLSVLPIVDDKEHVIGAITKRDILNELRFSNRSYIDIMSIPVSIMIKDGEIPPLATGETVISDAIEMLLKSNFYTLFTVDLNNKLMGAVSYFDIMEYIFGLHQDNK
uniref:CBS domain-containing protein n=1 Tax=Parastrongyloides trichosuri TaxID=131310 RepID=A0A0N4ZE30_PARTI